MTGLKRLNRDELEAWRQLQRMQMQLTAALSRDLMVNSAMSYQDFLVLVILTDQPGGTMRAFELGRELGWEKSRLSHHVSRMAERGLVKREKCGVDRRGAFVVVTPRGRKAIEAAAPAHVGAVRRRFVDLLTPTQLKTVGAVASTVLAGLEAECKSGGGPECGDGSSTVGGLAPVAQSDRATAS